MCGASGCRIRKGKINNQGVPELNLMWKMSWKDQGLRENSTKLTDHVVQVVTVVLLFSHVPAVWQPHGL